MINKKKGSSLIMVLCIFSILIIFGLSILSLTLSSYKKRIVESTEKTNQYFSESGLDVTYGIIGKTVDSAIDAGNKEVKAYRDRLYGNDKDSGIINEEKERFKKGEDGAYPRSGKDTRSRYLTEDGQIDEEFIKKEQNELFKKIYENHISVNLEENLINDNNIKFTGSNNVEKPEVKLYALNNKKIDNGESFKKLSKEIEFSNFNNILGENKSIKSIFEENKKNVSTLKLLLQSQFKAKNVEKTIRAQYEILVPNYNEPYYVERNNVTIPLNVVWSKAFCINGNLKIKGNFKVEGNVYAKGKDDGGIEISQDRTHANFKGNVCTMNNFNLLYENSNVNIEGNVYAGNVTIDEGAKESKFIINPYNGLDGALYTNNDLEINARRSTVDIGGGFYGLNDINTASFINSNAKPIVSSSILINTEDLGEVDSLGNIVGSKLAIGNKAIIMGTAYVQVKDPSDRDSKKYIPYYQTGESVAIKGNYKAYTNPLISDMAKYQYEKDEKGNITIKKDSQGNPIVRANGGYKEDNVVFDYINPLNLVRWFKPSEDSEEKIKKEMLVKDKSDYFNIFKEEKGSSSGLNLGRGIQLPDFKNIINTGVVVSNNEIGSENNNNNYEGFIRKKQGVYAKAVYRMEDIVQDEDEDFKNSDYNTELYNLYSSKNAEITVSTQVHFDNMRNLNKDKNPKGDIIYLNNDENKELVLVGKNVDKRALSEDSDKYYKLYLDETGNGRGIIITKGNVKIYGEVNFTGTIITNGDIIIEDNSNKSFKYDSNYVKRLIAYNYKYFENIFTHNSIGDSQNIETDSVIKQDNVIGTVRDKLINISQWRIIK